MPHHAKPDTNPCADLDAIRAKAETFFEWPPDDHRGSKRRDFVTYTSCLLFARACINDWQAKHQDILAQIEEMHAAVQRAIQMTVWHSADTAPIDTPLLATYVDADGTFKVIRAELIGYRTQKAALYDDCTEYDEASDCWYREAGWIELMEHWDDHDSCYINAQIIGWMPLPQPMEHPE